MSLYGYERETTPWMDAFFAEGAIFENAVAQFNTTVPTHTSMLTGVYPHTHGNRRNAGLSERFETLAEILSGEGFRTGAAVSGYPLKSKSSALDRGFEAYSSRFKGPRRDGGLTVDHALEWLRFVGDENRFFLFVHLYDAHGPYRENHHLDTFRSETPGATLDFIPGYQIRRDTTGEPIKTLNAYLDRYDAQIRYQDELVERLVSAVDSSKTLVLLTADHGETFVERASPWNFNHGHNLYREQTRIPLALRGPRVPTGRFVSLVETVDFLPTILALLDIEADGASWEGESFAPLLGGSAADSLDGLAFSSSDSSANLWKRAGYLLDKSRQIHALESRRWKLIWYPGVDQDYFELFDLQADPGETHPVASEHPEVVERMQAALVSWLGDREVIMPEDLESDLDALRALGYVN